MRKIKLKSQKIRLPKEFKEKVTYCELQLETSKSNQSIIKELTSLYTIGRDYYMNEKDKILSEYYKSKLNQISKIKISNVNDEEPIENNETSQSTVRDKNKIYKLKSVKLITPLKPLTISPIKKISVPDNNYSSNDCIVKPTLCFTTRRDTNAVSSLTNKTLINLMNNTVVPKSDRINGMDLFEKFYQKQEKIIDLNELKEEYHSSNKKMTNEGIKIGNSKIGRNNKLNTSFTFTSKPLFLEKLNYETKKDLKRQSSIEVFKKEKKIDSKLIKENVKNQIDILDINQSKVDNIISNEIEMQKEKFEAKKKFLMENSENKTKSYLKRNGPKFEKIIKRMMTGNENETVNSIINYAQEEFIKNQNLVHKEIEEYITKNYQDIEENIRIIRESYEDDINRFDNDPAYEEVIENLREEMNKEINNYIEKNENEKNAQIEKIKARLLKKEFSC